MGGHHLGQKLADMRRGKRETRYTDDTKCRGRHTLLAGESKTTGEVKRVVESRYKMATSCLTVDSTIAAERCSKVETLGQRQCLLSKLKAGGPTRSRERVVFALPRGCRTRVLDEVLLQSNLNFLLTDHYLNDSLGAFCSLISGSSHGSMKWRLVQKGDGEIIEPLLYLLSHHQENSHLRERNGKEKGVSVHCYDLRLGFSHRQLSVTRTGHVAGHIGRAAAVFRFNEIVVVDEDISPNIGDVSYSAALLARLLQYQETPQYLRKHLIPLHDDLRCVGSLQALDAPHHRRATEWSRFREGVVLQTDVTSSIVDIGLDRNALVKRQLRSGARVTLRVGHRPRIVKSPNGADCYSAQICDALTPLCEYGEYWGFSVRIARGMHSVFVECPYEDGYDLVIGTSEHGHHMPSSYKLPSFRHLLVGFGGPEGLEDCCRRDPSLCGYTPQDFCHFYLNTCPRQGSRTIRTEEAIWISLSYLDGSIDSVRV